jgi:hypothetical protein
MGVIWANMVVRKVTVPPARRVVIKMAKVKRGAKVVSSYSLLWCLINV